MHSPDTQTKLVNSADVLMRIDLPFEDKLKAHMQTMIKQLQLCQTANIGQEKQHIDILYSTIEQYFKKTDLYLAEWLSFLKSIKTHILASSRRIQHTYGRAVQAVGVISQLNAIDSNIDQILSSPPFNTINKSSLESTDYAFEKSLYASIKSIGDDFINFLKQIKELAANPDHLVSPPKIFISHAWETKESPCNEFWLDDFVDRINMDLLRAGVIVNYDKENSGAGISRKEFMNQKIDEVDHIIVICCRTMKYKFDVLNSGVSFEYLRYMHNYKVEKKNRYIIPLCLNKEDNAPGLVGLFAEVSVYHQGYVAAFLELLTEVYGFGSAFWQQLNDQLADKPNLRQFLSNLPAKVRPLDATPPVAEAPILTKLMPPALLSSSIPVNKTTPVLEGEYIPKAKPLPPSSQASANSSLPRSLFFASGSLEIGEMAGTTVIETDTYFGAGAFTPESAQLAAQIRSTAPAAKPPAPMTLFSAPKMVIKKMGEHKHIVSNIYVDEAAKKQDIPPTNRPL
jgi:hypothetical protein